MMNNQGVVVGLLALGFHAMVSQYPLHQVYCPLDELNVLIQMHRYKSLGLLNHVLYTKL